MGGAQQGRAWRARRTRSRNVQRRTKALGAKRQSQSRGLDGSSCWGPVLTSLGSLASVRKHAESAGRVGQRGLGSHFFSFADKRTSADSHGTGWAKNNIMPIIMIMCILLCLLCWYHAYHYSYYNDIMTIIMLIIMILCISLCSLEWYYAYCYAYYNDIMPISMPIIMILCLLVCIL